jgi:rod shape determining protein RodA
MSNMMKKISGAPWAVVAAMAAIVACGVIFVFSASWRVDENAFSADPYKQIAWVALGAFAFAFVATVNYMKLARWAYFIYGACLALVLVCYAFPPVNGATRWIPVGPLFSLQPSEFMKIAAVLALSRYLMYRDNLAKPRKLVVPFLLVLLPTLAVLKQPDLGTALLFIPILFALLYCGGARVRHLALALAVGAAMLPAIYFFALHDYQRARLAGFLNPEKTSLQEGYQVVQSKIAIGSGGLAGQGLGQGSQNWSEALPFDQTDFIFAVIGEEWGFIGAAGLLALYFALFALSLAVALRTREPLGRLIIVGAVGMLAAQVIINAGMTMGLMPVTGMTLPFVSYGGSSVLSSFILMGLVANVAMHRITVFAAREFQDRPL